MKPVKTNEGIRGVAAVQVHPSQPKVKVVLKPTEEGATPVTYVLEKENCPETVRNGTYIVNLSGDGKKMYSLSPVNGMAKLKVKEFIAAKDKEPVAKTKVGKFGPYMTFAVSFEIQEGKDKGLTVLGSFPFDFIESKEDVPGKGLVSVLDAKRKSKSPGNDRLWELLQVTAVDKMTLPYEENPLPRLQKYMLRNDKTFSGAYKDGWTTSLFSDE